MGVCVLGVVAVTLLVCVGCGGGDSEESEPTATTQTTTTGAPAPSRAEIGERIAAAVDPEDEYGLADDPAALAAVAATYCSELERSGAAEAQAVTEAALYDYLLPTQGEIGADLNSNAFAGDIAAVAVEELCPDSGCE